MKKRKDNTNNYNSGSGIVITDSISLTFNSKYWINSRLILIVTALAGIIGFNLSFLSLFDFECSRSFMLSAEAAVFIVSAVICMFPSKAKYLFFPVYFLIGYGIYRTRVEFSCGYAQFINIIAERLNITQPDNPYYRISEDIDKVQCLTLFLTFLFSAEIIIICYNTIVEPRFNLVFAGTFPFIESGLIFGISPSHIPFSLLVSYWVALFAMRIAGNQYHSESGKPVFVRKKNMFVSSGNLRNNVIEDIGMITMVSVFAVFIAASGVISLFKIERPEKVKLARAEIKALISDFSIEKIANNMNDDSADNPVTEKSRLGDISKISFKNKTDLTLFVSDKIPGNLYLKGFTGSVYRDNTWYALPDSTVSENSELFKGFRESGNYPQYYNYSNDLNLNALYPGQIRKCHMILNSWFKINKYAFVPYSISPGEMLTPVNDGFFSIDNLNSYSYDAIMTPEFYSSMNMIYKDIDRLNGKISSSEKEYRKFVYEHYLLLPESEQMNQLAEEYSYIPDYNGRNIEEIYTSIRDILHKSADYSLEPGKTPSADELTHYMLTENHKGYCSHFATAGVVLARLNGVPARYAEGYIAVSSDIEKSEIVNSYFKININDSRAHAWAEFYIDGYGWLPFEFTPGYDRGIISAEADSQQEVAAVTVTETVTEPPEPVTEIVTVTEVVTEALTESPEVTTAPVTSAESQDNGNGISSESGSASGEGIPAEIKQDSLFIRILRKVLNAVLWLVLFVLIVFVCIAARHIIMIRNRIMSFRCSSNNESMSNVYRYTLSLLEQLSISKRNKLPLEFAEYAEKELNGIIKEGELTELINTALKAGFSSEEISDDELRASVKTANTLSDSIYRSKNKRDRLIFRYILNLGR
ncbi:MAG: transglutaminase-like domain-containing protein [Oscillospiraceae bacterium]|nr:transglutaminase-like domain-containing protein [Oscillospiraceae bacterium]